MSQANEQHLGDYLEILRRRKRQFFVTMAVIVAIALVLAIAIPAVYRSTGTILIEQQEIPEDLVRSTVTGYASQRIQIITKRLVTNDNLRPIIEKLNIYKEERQAGEIDQIIAEMRNSIEVETVDANVTDPRSGRSRKATIAFTVSFDADTPEVAHKVATELVGLYLNENLRIRTEKAEVTSGFLSDEEKKAQQHVLELESKLAAYKEENAGRLPELMNLNLKLMERTERELEETERRIYNLEERKVYLESQLAQLEPNTGNSPAARLRELQMKYLSTSALYAPDHPDLARMRREIGVLKKEIGVIDQRDIIAKEINNVHAELAVAREKYSEDHPDVVKLERSLVRLKKALKKAGQTVQTDFVLKPDNPAYVSIQTQLEAVNLNLIGAREKRQRGKERLFEYETRLTQMPRVEQEGIALKREYENALKKYRDIKQSLTRAELAVELEKGQKGESYSLLEPPVLPTNPEKPNRRAILLLGIVLGVGSGIGYASIAEYMDRTIRGAKAVTSTLGAPPLAVIPYIKNGEDRNYRRQQSG